MGYFGGGLVFLVWLVVFFVVFVCFGFFETWAQENVNVPSQAFKSKFPKKIFFPLKGLFIILSFSLI